MQGVTLKKLLIVMTNLPFPVRKNGFSIRYYPIIKYLSNRYDITLLVISDVDVKDREIEEAKAYCKTVVIFKREKSPVPLYRKLLTFLYCMLPHTVPFHYFRYDQRKIQKFAQEKLTGINFDVVLCVQLHYLDVIKRNAKYDRLVMDLIDSDYSYQSRLQPKSLIKKYDLWKLKRWEPAKVKTVDHAIYISLADLQMGAGNQKNRKASVIPNGIYSDDINLESIDFRGPTLGFLGHMSYPPNIKAALRLSRIFKEIKHEHPNAKLVIIGRSPSPEIRALNERPGIIVTDTVDNIWPYVNGVDVFVFPMEAGTGQQNKLLETMFAGKPVVTTPHGNSGVGGINRKHLIEATTDKDIIRELSSLLGEKELQTTLGNNAREFVGETYLWSEILKRFDEKLSPG